jgi:hypothetical protein
LLTNWLPTGATKALFKFWSVAIPATYPNISLTLAGNVIIGLKLWGGNGTEAGLEKPLGNAVGNKNVSIWTAYLAGLTLNCA